MALLTAAQARFPHDFWLNFELGWAFFKTKRWDEALGYHRVALALRPKASAAHNALGETLIFMGRLEEALGPLEEALRLDPNYAAAHGNLGLALRNVTGRLDEAIEHYRQALSINPKSAATHINLGYALNQKRRREEAIEHYQRALNIEPKSTMAHMHLGGALYDKGRLEEAIGHFRQALSIEPQLASAQLMLSVSWYDAACAAVLDAAGQRPDKARLGDLQRADKRRQALGWLKAHLELTTKLLSDGKLPPWSFGTWQTDSDLASVRDPAALAKLPDAERELWQRLWAEVAALVASDRVEQGRASAKRRDWTQAADCYGQALKRGSTDDSDFWFECAALLLLSGDRAGYIKACDHLIERCGKDGGPRAYHVARACTLAPDVVANMSLAARLVQRELTVSGKQFWSLTEQGALAYRAGRFELSVPLFEKSLQANAKPGAAVVNWVWLALANQRLGRVEEARRWLVKAQAWLDQYPEGMPPRADMVLGLHLHNWLEAHVLRREAEALILPPDSRSITKNRGRDAPRK